MENLSSAIAGCASESRALNGFAPTEGRIKKGHAQHRPATETSGSDKHILAAALNEQALLCRKRNWFGSGAEVTGGRVSPSLALKSDSKNRGVIVRTSSLLAPKHSCNNSMKARAIHVVLSRSG